MSHCPCPFPLVFSTFPSCIPIDENNYFHLGAVYAYARGLLVQGGRRKIILPPELAFGKTGRPPFIPADATVQ